MDGKKAGFQVVAGPFLTLEAAKAEVKAKKIQHGGNGGEWRTNSTGCKQYMHCNRHVDCQVQLCFKGGEGHVCIYITQGLAHSLETKDRMRKNAPLTYEEERAAREAVASGKAPKKVMEAVQLKAVEEGWATKLPDGGIEGDALMS